MSLASKLILGTCCLTTVGIITYVHLQQQWEREQLHAGVIRDIERQQRMKNENIFRLQQQIELTKEYQKNQPNEIGST